MAGASRVSPSFLKGSRGNTEGGREEGGSGVAARRIRGWLRRKKGEEEREAPDPPSKLPFSRRRRPGETISWVEIDVGTRLCALKEWFLPYVGSPLSWTPLNGDRGGGVARFFLTNRGGSLPSPAREDRCAISKLSFQWAFSGGGDFKRSRGTSFSVPFVLLEERKVVM